VSPSKDLPRPGLRERKKARTHADIQAAALQLFQRQGYNATTADQIAEAAKISRITFFRYFPSKADVVLHELFDTTFVEAFRVQPPRCSPVHAMRSALQAAFLDPPDGERARVQYRDLLLHTIPELRAAMQQRLLGKLELLTELVAERLQRPRTDVDVLVVAGAMIGVGQAAWIGAEEGPPDGLLQRYHALFDAGLARLEAGLPH
jgi:AcrR family transcriptional regulator